MAVYAIMVFYRYYCMAFYHSQMRRNVINKSAAGMQHTPPWDIFNVKKIILKLDLFMQSLKKIGKEMPNIESENQFISHLRAITLYLFVQIYPSANPEHSFTISTLIPSLKKIGKGMPKIDSKNQFLTSIKGRNAVLICQNLPICNPGTLLPNINSYSKFEANWLNNDPSRG